MPLQLALKDGTVGLREPPGGAARLERPAAAAKVIVGMDVFDTTAVAAAIDAALLPTVPSSHERGRLMQQRYGFRSFKLKGGVFPAEAFPGRPLRLDANTAWTVETSRYVVRRLDGVLEYLEDPTATITRAWRRWRRTRHSPSPPTCA